MNITTSERAKLFGIRGGKLIAFGIFFGYILFPPLLKFMVHKQVNLKKGGDTRELWSKFPFYLNFKVYLYNVTNPDEISNGEKPALQEVGPYFFEKWQDKADIVDRGSDDTVEYAFRNKYFFRSDLSNGHTGDEELIVPHVFMLALVMTVLREKPAAVPIANKAINSIFKNPTSLFIKVKAKDVLMDGIPIDCTVKDFAGAAVCSQLRQNPEGMVIESPDKYKFSFFGAMNNTPESKRVRVKRGIKKQIEVGKVVEYAGLSNISKWNDEECDKFRGTDGTVFPPFLEEGADVLIFAPGICRHLTATYVEKSVFAGIKTNRYTMFLGDPQTMPDQLCYCASPVDCLKAGVMDMYKCLGVPLVMSHPHFYLADESYLKMINGLSPSKKKHKIVMDFDSFTGSPLFANVPLQINIMIHKVEKVKIMKNFPEALLPLIWFEEGIDLPKFLIKQIKQGHMVTKIANFLKWILILSGLGMLAFAGYLNYSNENSDIQIQHVEENSTVSDLTTEENLFQPNMTTLQVKAMPRIE